MWIQYVADAGSAADQVEAASIRTSLRRMSQPILLLENENGQSAAVLPAEEKEESDAAGSPEANDEDMDDDLGNEDNKGSFAKSLAALGNMFVTGMVCIAYPVAILPYYRAESTTE